MIVSKEERDFVNVLSAIVSHEMDGLRLFRPTEEQEKVLRGIIETRESIVDAGNRAGKTVLGAVWFASYVRDEPITCWDGSKIYCRPEEKRGKAMLAWVTGNYLMHIGAVIYRMLLDPHPAKGVFKIIRDEKTGSWRAWAPHKFENDWDRIDKTRESPPLIPGDLIVGGEPSWVHRNLNQWAMFKMKADNTVVHAYASSAALQQGVPVDCLWNDEELVTKRYWAEWIMRLPDSGGQILWTTIPRDVCPVYHDVCRRAEEAQEKVENGVKLQEDVLTRHFSLSFLESPFIREKDKQFARETLGEREMMVRVYGKASTALISIYQDFSDDMHRIIYEDEQLNDKVSKAYRDNGNLPPSDWCRELSLDPGTQKPGVLLCAIPPEEMWDQGQPYLLVYDEIYGERMDAMQIAKEVQKREHNNFFERFIGDGQALRQTPMGFGKTIGAIYGEAFAAHNLMCKQTGSMFVYGSNDFKHRSMMVMDALRVRGSGVRPQLRIDHVRCPHLMDQMRRNIRKTDPDGNPLEEPAGHQKDDLRVALEYWVSRTPRYFAPPVQSVGRTPGIARYEAHKEWSKMYGPQESNDHSIPLGVSAHRSKAAAL